MDKRPASSSAWIWTSHAWAFCSRLGWADLQAIDAKIGDRPARTTRRAPSHQAGHPVPPGVQIQFREVAGQPQAIGAGEVLRLSTQGYGAAPEAQSALAIPGEKQI